MSLKLILVKRNKTINEKFGIVIKIFIILID